jgi:hypothetical protein
MNSSVNRYICELLLAVCAIVSGFAQLKITLINWQTSTEESGDNK